MIHNPNIPLTSERFTLIDGRFTIGGRLDTIVDETIPGAPSAERTIALANGLFGNRSITRNFSQELVAAAWGQLGERWNVFSYSETASYQQDDHTAAFERLVEYAGSRSNKPLVAMGYSRGCVSTQAVHEAQRGLVGSSVYVAPPACVPMEKLPKRTVIAKAAELAVRDSNLTFKNMWHETATPSRRYAVSGLQTTAVLGISAVRHIAANLPEAVGEVYGILQAENPDFISRLVNLHEQTAATAVFSCDQDVFCPSERVEYNLLSRGYSGDMYRLTGATHTDVVARPYRYAPDIVRTFPKALN